MNKVEAFDVGEYNIIQHRENLAMRFFLTLKTAAAFVVVSANMAFADIVYPTPGSQNPQTYNFVATSTGVLLVYFAGSTASHEQQLGLLVNGVSTGLMGLNNHTSTVGDAFNFGHVAMGDFLTFFIR